MAPHNVTMKHNIILVYTLILLTTTPAEIIFNTPFTDNNDIPNFGWTYTGTGIYGTFVNMNECGGVGHKCLGMDRQGQMYHFESTLGYNNIKLRYSANASGLEPDDECRI
eukprot:80683_1